ELDLHLGAARHDARRVRVEQHPPDRPYGARPGDRGKAVVNMAGEAHHRGSGIAAPAHLGRAGVVLLAGDRDPIVPDADDPLDNAYPQPGGFERVALLDMGFEVAQIARWVDPLARPAGIQGIGERLAQALALAAGGGADL